MNDKIIVENMITFIEDKERQLQAQKLSTDTAAKNDVINAILDRLEKEISDENK